MKCSICGEWAQYDQPQLTEHHPECPMNMTEEKWLISTNPQTMLQHLYGERGSPSGDFYEFFTTEVSDRKKQQIDGAFVRHLDMDVVAVGNADWLSPATGNLAAVLVRDVIGNPFRPVVVDPAWLTWRDGAIPKIAQHIHEELCWEDLGILADALEEAGCQEAAILDHCRQQVPCDNCIKKPDEKNHPPGMMFIGWGHGWQPCLSCGGSALQPALHVRGCWVVEALREGLV